jgi:hypothetical protein
MAFGLLLTASTAAPALHAQSLPFDAGWQVSGDARVEPYQDRMAMRMRTGQATRRDVNFQDGTIDLHMAMSGRRTFGYVRFRQSSDAEYEEFYVRPQKSELADAIQYAPVFRGESYWQFFHGSGGTAAVELPRGRWIPVRIVLSGERAAFFVGDTVRPAMVVPRMARTAAAGFISLRSFLPAGSAPEGEYPMAFADVVVRPGYVPYDFAGAPEPASPPPGAITQWLVSPSFVPPDSAAEVIPDSIARRSGWTAIDAEPSGQLLLFRERARPVAGRRTAIMARVIVRADRAGRRALRLGYSDQVTVFLNGQPLASGDATYHADSPRQDGVVALSQATVYLPLRAGPNDLTLWLADTFGGWGFIAQMAGRAGLTITTPARP